MDVRHRITFFDTEIQVNQKENDVFLVSILSNATPLGSGNLKHRPRKLRFARTLTYFPPVRFESTI